MGKRLLGYLVLATILISCEESSEVKEKRVFAFMGKSLENPIYLAAEKSARAAADSLSKVYDANIIIDCSTPETASALWQKARLEQLSMMGVKGFAISALNASSIGAAINASSGVGMAVVCFDSDVPSSMRESFIGADDEELAGKLVETIDEELNGGGKLAVLSGFSYSSYYANLITEINEILKNYQNLELPEDFIFYTNETPQGALDTLEAAMERTEGVDGWMILLSEPFIAKEVIGFDGAKAVAVDVIPQLLDEIERGDLNAAIARDYSAWGRKSIELIAAKSFKGESPENTFYYDTLKVVGKENASEWLEKWEFWLE